MNNNRLDTHGRIRTVEPLVRGFPAPMRFKVTALDTANPKKWVKAKPFDGTSTGEPEYVIASDTGKKVDDEIFAQFIEGGAGINWDDAGTQRPIHWKEIAGGTMVKWGKVKTQVNAPDNTAVLVPTMGEADLTPSGEADVTVWLFADKGRLRMGSIPVNTVMPYIGNYLAVSPVEIKPDDTISAVGWVAQIVAKSGGVSTVGFDELRFIP